MPSLRLLSVDARSVGRHRDRLAEVIAAADPEVVCVHGGPAGVRWRQAAADLARRSGRVVVGGGGHRAGTNLLLSTLAIDSGVTREVRFPAASRFAAAGAALAALGKPGDPSFVLVGATLIGNAAERLAQARQLQDAVDHLVPGAPPAVVSVQGADRPGTAAWQSLLEHRVAVGDRLFVDSAFDISASREVPGGTPARPAWLVELSI